MGLAIATAAGVVPSQEIFHKYLIQLRPLLVKPAKMTGNQEAGESSLRLYHPSLSEWFTQTKFCGPIFSCSLEEGNTMVNEWKKAEESEKPDLVVGLDERKEEMWML